MLNLLYGLLYSESRLALTSLGLDPGMGFLHFDIAARDSLACDLMEAVRPQIDAYLLDWITKSTLKREWFAESPDGNCRVTPELAVNLCATTPIWGRAVAPIAEWLAQELWISPRRKSAQNQNVATRLTQNRKRKAQGGDILSLSIAAPRQENACFECGKTIDHQQTQCGNCRIEKATKRMPDVARIGRQTSVGTEAQGKRRRTQLRHGQARRTWKTSDQPSWLTEQFYSERIQPMLAGLSGTTIAKAIGASYAYGSRIRDGERPHRRHWQTLAQLAGKNQNVNASRSTNVASNGTHGGDNDV
jgi:hypothetical protein